MSAKPQTKKLSQIARDPVVAAFLARGELDSGSSYAVSATPKPVLAGGAAAKVPAYA